jgi:Tfp pilus assembly PilM family ATPase
MLDVLIVATRSENVEQSIAACADAGLSSKIVDV